jgi:hypothetical protein
VRRPNQDPRVTDLRRYRRERERARRRAPPKPKGAEPFLGGRRNAGLILVAVIVVLILFGLLSGHRF